MKPQEALYWCEQFTDNIVLVDPQREKMVLALQAMKECKKALKKQISKKPKLKIIGTTGWNTEYRCPTCNGYVTKGYCFHCGQALDWSDTE